MQPEKKGNDLSRCHLWQAELVTEEEVNALGVVETFAEESHLIRKLKKCEQCGQLYFYQFREEVDYVRGEDPVWRILIPVETREDALALASENEAAVSSRRPRIQWSWTDAKEAPHWMR